MEAVQPLMEMRGHALKISLPDEAVHVRGDFSRLSQVKRSGYSSTEGGLGIGLSRVRLITDLHDGRVEVHSESGDKRSEFRVTLPRIVAMADAGGKVSNKDRNAPPISGKIVVIDDGMAMADTLSMFLGLEGFETFTAYDGPSGLEIAREHRTALAFVDIGMPEMDGNETARLLRRIPGCEAMVLVALTGWGQEEDRRKTSEAGFDHHLVKPA